MGCGRNQDSSSFHGDKHDDRGCICEVVKSILKIQNTAVKHDCDTCGTSCFLEPLGGLSNRTKNADTRVFMLLDELGRPFKVMARSGYHFFPTCFFRVEDVFGDCCATLRALEPVVVPYGEESTRGSERSEVDEVNSDDFVVDLTTNNINPEVFSNIRKFKKTETCVTVDLNNFTAIQCVADCDLNICN